MTWKDLYMLLESMNKAQHTSLCDTPQQEVSIIMNDTETYVDLHESLTTGKLVFVPMMSANGDG